MNRRVAALAGLALAIVLVAGAAGGEELDGREDFGQIARHGFAEAVDGSYVLPDGSLVPDLPTHPLGSKANSYPWASALWSDTGGEPQLWIGTARNLLCFLSALPPAGYDCPAGNLLGFSQPRFPQDAAEIWRYTPGGAAGLDGAWERLYQSPTVPEPTKCLFSTPCATGPDLPRQTGVRNALACDADDDGPKERLYFTGLGIFASILFWDDTTQSILEASSVGDTFVTAGSLLQVLFGGVDLGYRGLACFDGKLCTAPAGSVLDPDASSHPWVICNEDPSDTASPWVAHSSYGFGDTDDEGIFELVTVDNAGDNAADWMCAGALDRDNGGSVQCTDGTGCDVDLTGSGGTPDGIRDCAWVEVVRDGMGRPEELQGDDYSGPPANAAAFGFGTFDADGDGKADYLYYGMAEAGASGNNDGAEMGRIDVRPTVDGSPNPNYMKWQLVVGAPRITSAAGGACLGPLGVSDPFVPPAEMSCVLESPDGALPACACMPLSGRGVGMGDDPFARGTAGYFWKFQQHEGDLWVGDLDNSPDDTPTGGFDLWKATLASGGLDFILVTNDGLGTGPDNYGVRALVTSDPSPGIAGPAPDQPRVLGLLEDPVLFVGAANPYTPHPQGGLQMFLGTDSADYSPLARGEGPGEPLLDDDACFDIDDCSAGDGSVDAALDGTASLDPFGGSITAYRWYAGDLTDGSGGCAIGGATPIGTTAQTIAAVSPLGDPLSAPVTVADFTLEVVDDDTVPQTDCDLVQVTAISNLPPFAELVASNPPAFDLGGAVPRVKLVDFDGDGRGSFTLTGRCTDPEASLASCAKGLEAGLGVETPGVLAGTVAAFSTRVTFDEAQLGGDTSPAILLEATDAPLAHVASTSLDVTLEGLVDSPSANDAPLCANGSFATLVDTPLSIDPTDPAAPLCADPDPGDTLSYSAADPPHGSVADGATLDYTPDGGFIGFDGFTFSASDAPPVQPGSPESSSPTGILMRVISCILPDPVVDRLVEGETIAGEDRSGCLTVTALNSTQVTAGPSTFLAGEQIRLGNGFSIASGVAWTARIDPTVFSDQP